MTSNFEDFKHNQTASTPNSQREDSAINNLDHFELLSAYIDGELSPEQKKQVQDWLDQDPKIKRLYTQLLVLQGQMQHSVAPPGDQSVAEITSGVFKSIDRRRGWQRKLAWGGMAIAASCLATISGVVPGLNPDLRLASVDTSEDTTSKSVMLAVAVNKPAIDIPKAATANYLLKINSDFDN